MQYASAPRGGRGGGRGRGGRGGNGNAGYGGMQPQYPGAMVQQPFSTAPGMPQGGFVQPGAYGGQVYAQPGGYDQNGGYQQGGRGQQQQKKPPKMANHIRFDQTMLLNVNASLAQGEVAAPLSSFALSCLPAPGPGLAPLVSVYTGDFNGVTREFRFETTWIQKSRAQHEGPITCLLSVHPFFFVGVQQKLPSGHVAGLLKVYNLANPSSAVLQDPTMPPAAHALGVKTVIQAGEFLVSGGFDGQVKAWRLGDGAWTLHGKYGGDAPAHAGVITAMSGKCPGTLITASERGDLRAWRVNDGMALSANIQGHTGPVAAMDVLIVPTGQYVLTSGEADGAVRMWSAPTLEPIYQIALNPTLPPGVPARPNVAVTSLRVVQTGNTQQLLIGYRNGNVTAYALRSTNNFEKLGFVDGHARQTKVLAFDTVATGAAPMLCVATDNGAINWFHFTA